MVDPPQRYGALPTELPCKASRRNVSSASVIVMMRKKVEKIGESDARAGMDDIGAVRAKHHRSITKCSRRRRWYCNWLLFIRRFGHLNRSVCRAGGFVQVR